MLVADSSPCDIDPMKTERILLAMIALSAVAGCATRDSSNLAQLHKSAVLLSRATAEALADAVALVEDNAVQKALEGDTEALEDMFLVSGGSFRMTPPGLGVLGAVVRAGEQVEMAGEAMASYTLFAGMVIEPSRATEAVWRVASIPLSGPLSTAAAVMVEQGVLEIDTRRLRTAMLAAAPGVDSLCATVSHSLADVSLAVNSSYQDISARLMRLMLHEGNSEHHLRELLALNSRVNGIMEGLRRADAAWVVMAAAHREAAETLGGKAVSVSFTELLERMRQLEERSY